MIQTEKCGEMRVNRILLIYFEHAFDILRSMRFFFSDFGMLFILLYKIFIIFVFKFIECLVDCKRRRKPSDISSLKYKVLSYEEVIHSVCT